MPEKPDPPQSEQPTYSEVPRPEGAGVDPSGVGKRLGDFDLLREIGRGGMGVVYEARQVSLNRRVALKLLPPGIGLSDQAIKRFEREARAAAKLHHSNIVPVHAIGHEEGTHFYAMELIEGQSLSAIIDDLSGGGAADLPTPPTPDAATTSSPTLSDASTTGREWFDTVAKLISEVADGLHYAHGRGIIHRDIKPGNLMLSGERRLCITDFGLARMTEEPGMTISGSFLGTPAYMSPEQIAAGRIKLDHRTDIYSLGTVLYELLTLQRPFPGNAREEILTGIMTREPKPPRKINPRIPLDLETICQKAMEKDPARRYASAGEMADDLRQYLQGGLIAARRASLLRRAVKFVSRHPVASISAVAVIALAAMALFAWNVAGQKSEQTALRAISDARYFLSQGDYREGLETVDAALADAPNFAGARLLRAQLLMKLDRYPEAVEEAQAILAADENDWTGHMILALAAKAPDEANRVLELSAEEHLAAVEARAPETSEVYYLRGLIEESDPESLAMLDRALELDPGNADALLERFWRQFDLKNYPAAMLDAERLAALRPRSAQGRRMIAMVHDNGLYDNQQALVEYERAIALDPDDPRSYDLRAGCYRDLEQWENALADLTRAIELDPDYARYYQRRAETLRMMARYEEALADAQKAVELKPEFGDAQEELGTIYDEMGQPDKTWEVIERVREASSDWKDKDARAHVLAGIAWMNSEQGNADAALAALDEVTQLQPDKPWVWNWRADLLKSAGYRRGFEESCEHLASMEVVELGDKLDRAESLRGTCERPDAASRALSSLIAQTPQWVNPIFSRAWSYRDEGRFEEALADFTKAMELAPRFSSLYVGRGHIYVLMNRNEDAIQDFDRYFTIDEGGWARQQRAVALLRLGREDEAFEDLDHSIAMDPDNGWPYRSKADILWNLGRLEETLPLVERAIEADPGDEWGYKDRALYRMWSSGSCDAAVADVRQADEMSSPLDRNHWAWTASVHVFFYQRFCPEAYDATLALELSKRAAEASPRTGWYHAVHGIALYSNGRYEEARAAFDRALARLFPPRPIPLYYQSMALSRLGLRDEARKMFDRGVARAEATWPDDVVNVLLKREATETLGL